MTQAFSYSVLQYRHSIGLGEALNVGVLFYFYNTNTLHFRYDAKGHRIKEAYSDFDTFLYKHAIHGIASKINNSANIFEQNDTNKGLKYYIDFNILNPDSTSLQFTKAFNVTSSYSDEEATIKAYTELYLPEINKSNIERTKRDERYIINKYKSAVLEFDRNLAPRFEVDKEIKTAHLSVKFDLAWQNGSLNLLRAVGFDLQDPSSIQRKSAENFGYLAELKDYIIQKDANVGLLISTPSKRELFEPFKKALGFLRSAPVKIKIITEENLSEYSEYTFKQLTNHSE